MANPMFHICIHCLSCKNDLEIYVGRLSKIHECLEKIEEGLKNHILNNHAITEEADASFTR